ncbi:stage III sporulation protein SpoIIIAB [Paenibacillus flagellatus]|uniref:Stage III sporulation protein AB n=1 Tax=Paenibacillus flagellatus TaxID=2211139 RepID=A0A2V5KAZ6_9BACL|nr:stage III sporulation protein SpoIIIAB [Paenibacillus flagellatus]PYI55063.1 stage III sporulation protein AB [Paenibacillus flagellatus]
MLKLIGAVLILTAGTLIGFSKAAAFARRPRQIRQLVHALQRLETEMTYGFTPLPEALLRIAERLEPPLAVLLRTAAEPLRTSAGATVAESWREAIDACWKHTALQSNEREIWSQLGFTLGISDRDDQAKHLKLAVHMLQAEEQIAWDEQRRYEKMWRSLGVLAGAFVVILMY